MTEPTEPNELAPVDARPLAVRDRSSSEFDRLLDLAEKGIAPELMERMVALHERMSDRQAAADFNTAFAAYTAERPVVAHNAQAKIASRSGSAFGYTFATFDQIDRINTPILHRHGFSWSHDVVAEGPNVKVTCRLDHVGGHHRTATIQLPVESSAGMSAQQKVASAITFGKRQSLAMVCGITTAEQDRDGAGTPESPDTPKITVEQEREISDLIDTESRKASMLRYLKVKRMLDIPASRFAEVVRTLQAKT